MSALFKTAAYTTQAYGQMQQANAESAALEYNAELALKNAGITRTETEADVERQKRENFLRTGKTTAAAAATGGLTGSALDVLASNAAQQELDILNIKQQGKLREEAYLSQARLDIAGSKNVKVAGKLAAASTVLTGVADVASDIQSAAIAGGA